MLLPEIVYGSKDSLTSQKITKLVNAGQLKPLMPRVYTSNFQDEDKLIVRRNLHSLIAHLFPNSILSHRTALEYNPSPKNVMYLTGKNRRIYNWPGVTLKFSKGPGPLSDDYPTYEQLFISSLERTCLENLMPSRNIDGEKRTLDQSVIEERLLMILDTRGEDGLNAFRERAKVIAEKLSWQKSFEKLNQIIGSILSTKSANILKSPIANARALGEPYDVTRLELFQLLIADLRQLTFPNRPQKTDSVDAYAHFSFFESFFSNFIEGTRFSLEEAEDIIYNNVFIPNRTGDTHDIKGTYKICADRVEMSTVPTNVEELVALLRSRHQTIMKGRPDILPGIFKEQPNRAGSTFFVEPALVNGTLKQGFKLMGSLTDSFARAIYMMFLITEVHPFNDGNGRIARIMMNAELVHAQQSKIIIPSVYREDYLLNLKKLTKKRYSTGFIKMLDAVARYSHWLEPEKFNYLSMQLNQTNAFKESEEAALILPKHL